MSAFDITKISKEDLFDLMTEYDSYIYNDGEPWSPDRQPVGLFEFYNNEYQEIIKTTSKKVVIWLEEIIAAMSATAQTISFESRLKHERLDCPQEKYGFYLRMPDDTEFAVTITAKGESLCENTDC